MMKKEVFSCRSIWCKKWSTIIMKTGWYFATNNMAQYLVVELIYLLLTTAIIITWVMRSFQLHTIVKDLTNMSGTKIVTEHSVELQKDTNLELRNIKYFMCFTIESKLINPKLSIIFIIQLKSCIYWLHNINKCKEKII